MAGILEMMGHIQSEGERGKQAGLSRLIGKAYNDPSQRQAALGRVAQFDGPAAFNAQAMFEKMDDKGRQRLGQRMAVFSALPDDIKAQAYPDIAREAQALGIPAPGEWNPEFAPHMQKIAQALTTGMQEMPTGFRQFQMTAEAAGLKPGSPEYQQAANIALGREGRASSAGFGFELTEGMDGRKRLQRRNPRTGAVEIYDESTGDFVPVGGMQASAQAPVNVPSGLVRTASGEMVRLDPNMPAADREAILAGRMNDNGSFQGAPMIQPRTANPNLVVGRRPEDEALATETAKQSVQTGFMPQQEAIKTDAAINEAEGVARAKAGVERETEAPKRISRYRAALDTSQNALTSIGKAEKMISPISTGFMGARMRGIEGSPAYNLAAEIETIKANLGFAELQKMRDNSPTGGALGQVAIQELVALQSTIANLDPNQSAEQLQENLQRIRQHYSNWRSAVQQAMQDEQARGQPKTGGAAPGSRQVKRTGTANGRKVVEYADGTIEYAD